MSIKKYRVYLMAVILLAVIIGVLSYFYFSEQDKSYKDGMLVWNEYVLEEEPG